MAEGYKKIDGNFMQDFNLVGQKMADTFLDYFILGFQKDLSYIYNYLSHLNPEKAEAALNSLPEEIRDFVKSFSADKEIMSPEVMTSTAHVLNAHGFNSPSAIEDITNKFPIRFDFTKAKLDLYEQNPLLTNMIEKSDRFAYCLLGSKKYNLQEVFQNVGHNTLLAAFADAPQHLKDLLLANVSKQNRKMLLKDFETAKITERQSEEAKEKIITAIINNSWYAELYIESD